MTNLIDHVTRLELSKQLKDIGLSQDSLFYWVSFRNESSSKEHWNKVYNDVIYCDELQDYEDRDYLKDFSFCSAYTASELIETLPNIILLHGKKYRLWIDNANFTYINYSSRDVLFGCRESNLANSCAEALLWFRKSNLMELPK